MASTSPRPSGAAPAAAKGNAKTEAACTNLATPTAAARDATAVSALERVRDARLKRMLTAFAGNPAGAKPSIGQWCRTRYPKNGMIRQATYICVAPITTTVPPEYPKEVLIDSIGNRRLRVQALSGANDNTTIIELAPGVYADKGNAPVGPASRYTGFFGLCADVNAYKEQGLIGGYVCW